MIIVSQDRKAITENMEVHIRESCVLEGEGYVIENDSFILARYKTEERAKEVLDEITNIRAIFELYKCSDANIQDIFDKKMLEENLIFDTYKMPAE